MKKLLLTLGTSIVTIAPLAAVISCSNVKTKTSNKLADPINDTAKPKQNIKKNLPVDPKPEQHQQIDAKKLTLANPFANVKEDGLYLWDQTYDGKLLNNKTLKDGEEVHGIQKIVEQTGWNLDSSVQLGKRNPEDPDANEDSFYMVYDDDDNDGLNMDNFTDTVFFEDTSVAMVPDIYKINQDVFGDLTIPGSFGSAEYVTFSEDKNEKYKGHINNYFGSQNNHVSLNKGYSTKDDFFKNIKKYVNAFKEKSPEAVNALLKYYGLKTTPDASGEYVEDPSILNHANQGFALVYYEQPIFTYEKAFDNVIKITYHDLDTFQATAAHFRIKEGKNKYTSYGSWSLGCKDWASYFGHSDAKYVGTKK